MKAQGRLAGRCWYTLALAVLAVGALSVAAVSRDDEHVSENDEQSDSVRLKTPTGKAESVPEGRRYLDASLSVDERVEDLLARMTLEEKLGQMTQIEVDSVNPGDVAHYGLGSVLSGGGGVPPDNNPEAWADMIDAFQEEALSIRLGIPLIYGVDAVHGHNNVVGATIFPHNIGLGAAGDAELVRDIGEATAIEMLATGASWNFAPVLAVPQDIRWGRTYEAYSDDTDIVTKLSVAFLEGLQSIERLPLVVGTPKHFVADGAVEWGTSEHPEGWRIDQGDTSIGEEELREVHLAPYKAAIDAGARTVMGSFSSWQGVKLHGRRDVLTGMLRDDLGFDGLLVSDWGAIDQIDPDYRTAVVTAVNAGIDMNMVPYDAQRWVGTLKAAVQDGDVPLERIDEAVRRILRVKFEMGLFEQPFAVRELLPEVGSKNHRALARRAAAASVVPLVGGDRLPLDRSVGRVLVAGEADDVGTAAGGWTITWQGRRGDITPGATILQGVEEAVSAETHVEVSRLGHTDESAEIGIVVVGEAPYAEGVGDVEVPALSEEDHGIIARARAHVDTLVVVVVSGRPLLLGTATDLADVVVAAWLPGSEAAGVADALFGVEELTGTLPMAWPDAIDQIGPGRAKPWLPRGHSG